jgi:curved DNA-binding protein CbpA
MAPRQPLPDDDLYRRLGVPTDAGFEAIEVAWRALLRRHHPDVAGPEGTELAKRINVAHDWLSDPALRARYDRERGLRHAVGPRGDGAAGRWHARDGSARAGVHADPAARSGTRASGATRRPPDPASALDRFVAHIVALTPTDVDRLGLAEPSPIAFAATIRRFVPPDRLSVLEALDGRIAASLPAGADRPVIRDAIDGYATELVLGPFLDELLSQPFRDRARERLTRGWESAVGQPRYGPNGRSVSALVRRIGGLDREGVQALAATVGATRDDAPWPPGHSPDEDDALRVSVALAAADAAAAVPDGVDAVTRSQARRAAGRPAHLLVLRHAFAPAAFAASSAPWRPWLLPVDDGPTGARRPVRRS